MGLGILPPPGIAPPKAPDVQDFTTSGTWTKPDGARLVLVECVGAGGGGGWSTASNYFGGNGGYYGGLFIPAEAVPSSVSVTIGAGGLSATSPSLNNPTVGGSTSFGTILSVPGGDVKHAVAPRQDGLYRGGDTTGAADMGAGRGGDAGQVGAPGGSRNAGYGRLQTGAGGAGANSAVTPGVAALPGEAPGGGGGGSGLSGLNPGAGAPGAARITTYF